MREINRLLFEITLLEQEIEQRNKKLSERRRDLRSALRRRNEWMLVPLPEEDAAILRRAADYGLLIEKVPQR